MSYYLLADTIQPCTKEELLAQKGYKYVTVLTAQEWARDRDMFDMGIELEPPTRDIHNTKAEVNYDSLTGTFQLPDREHLDTKDYRFAFAMDEKGIVFIDESGKVEQMIDEIRRTKRWRQPSLERFLYDFLEQIVEHDLSIMEKYEDELNQIEDNILYAEGQGDLSRVIEIHNDIRKLLVHYEQIIDMTQELEENENGFFDEENLRYIHLFMNLMVRRHDSAASLRDHASQVRDLYHAQLEVRQNRIMTLLTVITTIFMPLTLIVGWYGMNFRYMPELEWRFGYITVIVVSLVVVIACLVFFKKKKWL
ncbi:MAG: magnesium transporter CorA [Lachnospiraceae bacterium]|nr:magnesium transporter CorA [Lachnospiraceae bacterium]MBQ9592432.1 magnesium transporter CorA [Lachnospiraceae bacterium]